MIIGLQWFGVNHDKNHQSTCNILNIKFYISFIIPMRREGFWLLSDEYVKSWDDEPTKEFSQRWTFCAPYLTLMRKQSEGTEIFFRRIKLHPRPSTK
jgi:hypothetical protein